MKRNKPYNAVTTIGVMGAGEGMGTTHFVVMLATFLSAIKGERVAVVDTSPAKVIENARNVWISLCHHSIHKKELFSVFSQATEEVYTELVSLSGKEQFRYILSDCGNLFARGGNTMGQRIFQFSNRKMISMNLSWWKLEDCVRYMENLREGQQVELVANHAGKRTLGFLEKEYKQKMTSIPYNADPFCLQSDCLDCMERLTHLW